MLSIFDEPVDKKLKYDYLTVRPIIRQYQINDKCNTDLKMLSTKKEIKMGGSGGIRIHDLRVTTPLLY